MVCENDVIKMAAVMKALATLTACYFLFDSYTPLANFHLPSICLPFWWRENYHKPTLPFFCRKRPAGEHQCFSLTPTFMSWASMALRFQGHKSVLCLYRVKTVWETDSLSEMLVLWVSSASEGESWWMGYKSVSYASRCHLPSHWGIKGNPSENILIWNQKINFQC